MLLLILFALLAGAAAFLLFMFATVVDGDLTLVSRGPPRRERVDGKVSCSWRVQLICVARVCSISSDLLWILMPLFCFRFVGCPAGRVDYWSEPRDW